MFLLYINYFPCLSFVVVVEQAQLYTEATGHRQISISSLEEVIHKQTRELQQLKCDLLAEKEKNVTRVAELESSSTR